MKIIKIALFCIGLIPATNYTGNTKCLALRDKLLTLRAKSEALLQVMQNHHAPCEDQETICLAINQLNETIEKLEKTDDEEVLDMIPISLLAIFKIHEILAKFEETASTTTYPIEDKKTLTIDQKATKRRHIWG